MILIETKSIIIFRQSHVETLTELGFHQNYCTFASILLTKMVLCSKIPRTKFINYKCSDTRLQADVGSVGDALAVSVAVQRRRLARASDESVQV